MFIFISNRCVLVISSSNDVTVGFSVISVIGRHRADLFLLSKQTLVLDIALFHLHAEVRDVSGVFDVNSFG